MKIRRLYFKLNMDYIESCCVRLDESNALSTEIEAPYKSLLVILASLIEREAGIMKFIYATDMLMGNETPLA